MHALTKEFGELGVAGVQEIFKSSDTDGSGELDIEEVKRLFLERDRNPPVEDLEILMKRLDPDHRSGTQKKSIAKGNRKVFFFFKLIFCNYQYYYKLYEVSLLE